MGLKTTSGVHSHSWNLPYSTHQLDWFRSMCWIVWGQLCFGKFWRFYCSSSSSCAWASPTIVAQTQSVCLKNDHYVACNPLTSSILRVTTLLVAKQSRVVFLQPWVYNGPEWAAHQPLFNDGLDMKCRWQTPHFVEPRAKTLQWLSQKSIKILDARKPPDLLVLTPIFAA